MRRVISGRVLSGIAWRLGLNVPPRRLVLLHILRSLLAKRMRRVWISMRDLRDAVTITRQNLRLAAGAAPKPGKFSFAQKLIHMAFAVVVLAASATGAIMTAKMDTPLWDANTYMLSDESWGLVYVVHGFSALLLITMVMTHIYFALRPEKFAYLRAMVLGWITRKEFDAMHDPNRWKIEE